TGGIFQWLQRCDECIERLEEFCRAKRPRLAVGHRQSVVVRIARLAGAKLQLERKLIEPWRFLEHQKKEKHVNVLYVQDPRNDGVGHFAWIKNLSRLVSSQISGKKNKKFFCDRCLHYFSTNEKLQSHVMDCEKINDSAIRLPSVDDKWLEFENHCNKQSAPFIVYADLECHRFRRDEDCIAWFARQLNDLAHRVKNIVSANVPMETLSKEQLEAYPHANCNLNYKNSFYIPIVFHNLSGYDAHFIIKEIATAYEGHVDVLTKEKYISFTKHVQDTAERADSRKCIFKFLNANLDKLASFLSRDKLKIVRFKFSTLSDEEFELLTRKGVFPYVDCVEKLLLLADIFENFRESCIASYGLDPAHYYTLPGFTWDAMLKHTRIYDVNNLYGWAMCQPLPYAEFRWVEEAANFDVSAIALDSPTGYIFEVDLEYPQHLHDQYTDLPFCPTRDKPPGKREAKLLATLYDKQRYVHYRNLQQCTRHGLRVTKIHRVLQFAQSPWLRDYIELNTNFRTRAKNDSEKNLYKLMNNAVFGKTMENVRNHVDVKLLTKWDGRYGAEAMIAKPNFHNKKVPGLMKDENNDVIMTEFVGLRAKMYAVRVDGKKETKKAKGVKSNIVARTITPGCDLTELDTCWDPKLPYRKQGNKRIFASGSVLTDTAMRRQNHPPLDSTTNSYIPHDSNLFPPTVTIHKGQIIYHPPMDESVLYKTLKNECEPSVMFAINHNLYAYVKITNLNCCVNKICWNVTSRGLACIGQDEIILLVEVLPDETRIPKDLLTYINQLYLEAIKGNTVTELGFSVYQSTNLLLGSREHVGFLFIRQTLQCLQKIILPPAPFLIGLLVHRWETPWAKMFPLRLLLRLGAEYRYYPCPLVSVRFRNALYFEIGHTVMKVLADFRNFGYTLPGVRGLTIHLKNRTTDVMFPKNRYDQVIKGLHNSNDHVLAYASNFSITADSHLVCIQTSTGDESSYQTQAINIHNKPRTVTGASFIVINGALKSSMGLSAKSSIVEDGLMVEIMPEKMEALKAALKNMQDFSIGCGRQGALEPDEVVNIKWVDNDMLFNLGVKSPIDGQLMDGIPSIRVHNGIDYKGATRFIRWTEVFIIKISKIILFQKSDDHSSGVNDPVDINKLSGNIAKATCAALVKLLDLLATASLTKLGVRTTIHPDNVGYEAGSEGTKLPPIYMKSLDNELIQVLHKAVQSSQDAYTVLELIFYVLED
ncbi:ZFYV9 protein, partial [Acromyrmex charruanus]